MVRSIFLILLSCSRLAAQPSLSPDEQWPRHIIDDSSKGADGVKLGDLNNDGFADIVTGWEEGFKTRIYLHPGIDRVTEKWPSVNIGETPSVEDAVFVDLNGDDYLDVVASCEGQEMAMYLLFAPKNGEILDPKQWKQMLLPGSKGKTRWMFAEPADVGFGSKTVRLLFAASKDPEGTVGYWEIPRDAEQRKAPWKWRQLAETGWVMSILPKDMDGDGDLDLFYVNRKNEFRGTYWLENPGSVEAVWTNHLVGGDDLESLFAKIADLDQDGLEDIVLTAKDQQIIWWRRLDATGLAWEKRALEYPENTGSAKAVAIGDIDQDGLPDIVVTCENADSPKQGAFWVKQAANRPFEQWQASGISGPEGIKFDRIELIDLDRDGDLDVLTCEEHYVKNGEKKGLGVFWYENPISR
jgi:hypothetical protein